MEDTEVRTVAVVLNYNDWQTCREFLYETRDYGCLDRIIVVDNCSTDDSVRMLEPYVGEKVVLVRAGENRGYASGNNVGMRFANATYPNLKYIIISNPDIHVSDDDVRRILKPLDEGYAMTTGLIYNYDPGSRKKSLASNFGWRIPTYRDMLSNCFLVIYKIKRTILHNSMYLDWEEVRNEELIPAEAVPGCFFALRADVAKRIEYLDERTFLFGEETILGRRLKDAGYRACIVNSTEVLHENSVSINKTIKKRSEMCSLRLSAELVYIHYYLQSGYFKEEIYKHFFRCGTVEKTLIEVIARMVKQCYS